jgi:hypothetical protein
MDSRSKFRPRLLFVEATRDPGTKRGRSCGLTVQGRRRKPRPEYEDAGQPNSESCGVSRQEKLVVEDRRCPYRKPTQVGKASSLR